MADFKKLATRLKRHYGQPHFPPAQGPFELVLWENACYLLPDERRAAVFEGLRQRVGLNARAIWNADRNTLHELAAMGGMRPETRVFRWLEIARITLTQFDGNLDGILKEPYAKAKKALHQFPNIGEPGAEKILTFCGMASGLPLESNGCRVLTVSASAGNKGTTAPCIVLLPRLWKASCPRTPHLSHASTYCFASMEKRFARRTDRTAEIAV